MRHFELERLLTVFCVILAAAFGTVGLYWIGHIPLIIEPSMDMNVFLYWMLGFVNISLAVLALGCVAAILVGLYLLYDYLFPRVIILNDDYNKPLNNAKSDQDEDGQID